MEKLTVLFHVLPDPSLFWEQMRQRISHVGVELRLWLHNVVPQPIHEPAKYSTPTVCGIASNVFCSVTERLAQEKSRVGFVKSTVRSCSKQRVDTACTIIVCPNSSERVIRHDCHLPRNAQAVSQDQGVSLTLQIRRPCSRRRVRSISLHCTMILRDNPTNIPAARRVAENGDSSPARETAGRRGINLYLSQQSLSRHRYGSLDRTTQQATDTLYQPITSSAERESHPLKRSNDVEMRIASIEVPEKPNK